MEEPRLDLDAYFTRIAYHGPRRPTVAALREIMAAHVSNIPFENLDVLLGRPIELSRTSVFQKLVHDRRGGYCFEQNGLLLAVLQELGFQVTALSARVRLQHPRAYIPPRTHMFVRADIEGAAWVADVGVGALSLSAPLLLDSAAEQPTAHEPRRIVREEGRFCHQVRFGDAWEDVCEFTLEEMPPIDRELANWYTSAHPQSHFKNRLIVARAAANGGRLTLLNDQFKVRYRDGHTDLRTVDSPVALLELLESAFGLAFPPGTRFGAAGAPWPT